MTRLRTGRQGFDSRRYRVQTGSGTHPASGKTLPLLYIDEKPQIILNCDEMAEGVYFHCCQITKVFRAKQVCISE
jgi:hypothetical protein